jgi:3-oxoacyl-[acyl-carrier-protein] synthase II
MTGLDVVVTGVGLAVPGLAGPADLLGDHRPGGFDPATGLQGRQMRHKDRASRLALRAVEYALDDAGLLDQQGGFAADGDRAAISVSSNLGSLESVCEFADTIAERTVTGLSPLGLPKTSSNVIAGAIAIEYRLRGPNLTLCNGETSGLDALFWAAMLIAAGRAESALVVGVEPAGSIVERFVGAPVVDGAAAVLLEPAEAARARAAQPRAALAGYQRGGNVDSVVAHVTKAATAPLGLYLTDGPSVREISDLVPVLDLSGLLGVCSGALGVLQCAAAVARLRTEPNQSSLLTCGGPDAVAAMVVNPAA